MDKGLKILFDRYWTSAGWKDDYDTSEEDFAIVKSEGYMFDDMPRRTHGVMLFLTFSVFAVCWIPRNARDMSKSS